MEKHRARAIIKALRFFLTAVLLAGMFSQLPMPVKAVPAAIEADSLPEGLTSDDWGAIQAAIRQAEYQFTWHEPSMSYKAPNRAHGWGLAFTTTGVEVTPRIPSPSQGEGQGGGWSWGLSLTRYGYEGQLLAITGTPAQTVDANRVEYRHAEGQLVEWYLNDERGLEQGFTLQSPPLPRLPAPLRIEMAVNGDLTPRLTDDHQAILFADADGATILRYSKLHVTDATGRQLPAHLELPSPSQGEGPGVRVIIDDTAAIYPLTVDPLLTSQVAKLTASDGAAGDWFGYSVAISGDTVVVGAPDDDSRIGSAYVFERNQGGADQWGQVKKLTADDGVAADYFGYSVAISGDTVIVGAANDDDNGFQSGSAYVFERNYDPGNPGTPSADNWGQVQKLHASDGAAGDEFGHSVAISGDTVVVGACYDDDNGTNSGSAYVFERNQGGADQWGQVKKLIASDGAADDYFGKSVAISGDTVVVGAFGDGSAYVFERNQGAADTWGQVRKLTASDGAVGDWFGISVAISGHTVVVGALGDDSGKGSAYVFERNYDPANAGTPSADNWGQVKKLTASDGAGGDYFRYSVAISGDTLVVGAYRHDSDQGSAYVFERNQGGADQWGWVKKLTASDGAAGDWFGWSVAISGDTVVVGAYGDDRYKGSAYVFERSGGTWEQEQKRGASDGAADDNFGWSVAISGDTVVVGAWGDDDNGSYSGSAYVFERNQGGADQWGWVKKLTASDGAEDDRFGISVAISGDTVVVGAWTDDSDQGSAYVFERNQGGADQWGQVKKLTASDGAANDYFGGSVAISGDTVVVGAPYDESWEGSAYVFERNQGGADNWGEVKKLTASDGAWGDHFGVSVAISGDTVVVGAWGDDSDQGSAYVFERNQGGADQWGWVKKLTASDGAAADEFGRSVAISGDTVVVGADHDGIWQGSAYVFERNQGGADWWGQVKKLTADDGAAYDKFGYSVAISGDTVVAGAKGNDSDQGSAYVFERNQGGADQWGQVEKLTASDGAGADEFGYSVAIRGDTVVVGAPWDHVGANEDQGSAYVFVCSGGTWEQEQKRGASDGAAFDRFGHSVAISGDTVVVGAFGDDSGKGSAYVFERNQGGADNWGQVKKLTASDGGGDDEFGFSVAISGDTVVVGAWRDDILRGSAYVFERNYDPANPGTPSADNWGQVKKLTATDRAVDDRFGWSVAISGDTVVVGAHYDDFDQGSAYVFVRNYDPANPGTPSADNWGQVKKLTASDGAADDEFGFSVAISWDTVVVGAYGDDSNKGSAYVFRQWRCRDLNDDGVVNVVDIMLVVARWGMTIGDPGWDSLYDLDGSGEIDILDIMLVVIQWRQSC